MHDLNVATDGSGNALFRLATRRFDIMAVRIEDVNREIVSMMFGV